MENKEKHFEIYFFDQNADEDAEPELYFTTDKSIGMNCKIRKEKYSGTQYYVENKYYSYTIYENELNKQGIESVLNNIYNCVFSSGYFSSDYIELMGGNDAIYKLLEDESEAYKKQLIKQLQR